MKTLLLALLLAAPASAAPRPDPVAKLLARLTVEEKVGQLFMIAIDTEIAARYEPMIRAGKLGGAFERWDKFTGQESREFVAMLRTWTDASPARVPILVAADQEGGSTFTQRAYGGTVFPGNMALGAAGKTLWAGQAAEATAAELASWGIQIDFAPVVDVNDNPDNPIIEVRSFGDDPARVASLGAAAVIGYLRGGVMPAAKHFPGHGNAAIDSHKGLPVIARSLADWEKIELVPFRAAIRAETPIVMTAHIVIPAIDPASPVTLSTGAIEGLLRSKLGFKGVVVSDDLAMDAISLTYATAEASLRALQAGCDILLVGRKGDYPAAYEGVLAAVRDGRIPAKRLDASVRRILGLKKAAGLFGALRTRTYDAKRDEALSQKIADGAVTLLRDENAILPLALAKDRKLAVFVSRSARFFGDTDLLLEELRRRHAQTELLGMPLYPTDKDIDAAVEKARAADVVVQGTFGIYNLNTDRQAALYERLKALGKPVIVASLMNPYDLKRYADASALLAIYGMTPASMRALARALFGEFAPRGKLPVSIPGFFKRGDGLGWPAKKKQPR